MAQCTQMLTSYLQNDVGTIITFQLVSEGTSVGNLPVFGWDHGRDISISNGVLGYVELQNEDSITLWL